MYIYGCTKARYRQNDNNKNNMLSASVIINDCSALCNRTQPTYAVGAYGCARAQAIFVITFLVRRRYCVVCASHRTDESIILVVCQLGARIHLPPFPMDSVCAIPNYNMNFQSLTSRKTRKPNWKWKWASVGEWENRQQPSFTLRTLLSNDRVTLTKLTKQTRHDTNTTQ